MKVLLAEDERDLREVVAAYLDFQGYEVDAVENGQEAVEASERSAYDVVVLDVMMPVMDGLTAMRRIRETGNLTPALFLTAKSEIADRVEGLDAGADDYLTKPFSMDELNARLRAMGRRKREYGVRMLTFGNLRLDTEKGEIKAINTISLAHTEVRLLSCLISGADRMIPAEEILREVWQNEQADVETIMLYISFLRAKLQSVQADVMIEEDASPAFRLKVI